MLNRAARKTLYIHIGHFKTGTTALQTFFDTNRAVLKRAGLDYSSLHLNFSKHSRLAFSIYRKAGIRTLMHGYDIPKDPADLWAGLRDYVRASSASKVLVSSEEFARLGGFPEAAAMLPGLVRDFRGIDIRIVVYLRSPGSHLPSWYNQLVKMGQPVPDYTSAILETIEPVHYDYGLALAPWIDTFGPEAVIVRPYSTATRSDHGLVFDMLSTLGVEIDPAALDLGQGDPNPRLDPASFAVAQMVAETGLPERMKRNILSRSQAFYRDRTLRDALAPDMEPVHHRIRQGLGTLEKLPHNGVDCAGYAQDLPGPDDIAEIDPGELVPFLFSELFLTRQALNQAVARITALEKAAADSKA
ncbi:sulfotransferase family protein [Palleronia aestuarii]|nr:sulfotransferase family protein [Palleronia aestuarii]